MLFSSMTFLYYFLPAVLIVYFMAPEKHRNFVLLLASLLFYGWGEPVLVVLMLLSIAVQYVLGLLIEAHRETGRAEFWLAVSVCFSLGLLGYFKYADFFIANLNAATGLSLPLLRVALPIGISFYTFQILSYTIDVYRGIVKAQRNFFRLALYISLFPQLIAGPIVRYADVASAIEERSHSLARLQSGAMRFLFGLAKKVLIANSLGELCAQFTGGKNDTVLFAWMYAISFSLQLYYDFSAYSDMAIGLGRILGFDYMENFDAPFQSVSITEFWRRWHISLGSWFRDYVYIPLGGNRVSRRRHLLNLFVVWSLTGLWHGAAWNFVLWGLLFGIVLVLEKFWLGERLDRVPRLFAHAYVLLIVGASFVLFDAPSLAEALRRFSLLAGGGGALRTDAVSLYYLRSYGITLALAMAGCTSFISKGIAGIRKEREHRKIFAVIEPVFGVLTLLLVTAYLVDASFNPFLYFRF